MTKYYVPSKNSISRVTKYDIDTSDMKKLAKAYKKFYESNGG